MTEQEIFDTVIRFLCKQGKPSQHPITKRCMYQTSNGLKCAIGCLIPKENYEFSLEGKGVNMVDVYQTLEYLDLTDRKIALLTALQSLHDTLANWNDSGLKVYPVFDLADAYGLSIDNVKSLFPKYLTR